MLKLKNPGLGRGGLAWPESESARNFMDKCVDEKKSAKTNYEKNIFKLVGWICLRRVMKFTFLRFKSKTTKFGPNFPKSVKMAHMPWVLLGPYGMDAFWVILTLLVILGLDLVVFLLKSEKSEFRDPPEARSIRRIKMLFYF